MSKQQGEIIKPQEGFQMKALTTKADIAILGGAAGAGKTFVLLMEFLRHTNNPNFGGAIFRRTTPQIKNEGGLWDTSFKLFPKAGGEPKESSLQWSFPSGAKLKFSHMEYDKNKLDWQGSQVPFIGFDELTHFEESQFWYMLSRNRSDSGVAGYIRATCNPDPTSWVAKFIEWWIDQETGYPIPERDGVLRYFIKDGGSMYWGDTVEEVYEQHRHIVDAMILASDGLLRKEDVIKSVTFIAGTVYQNKELMKKDPAYLGNLLSLDEEERKQLLDGNWKVSVDGKGVVDFNMLRELTENFPEKKNFNCITCDPARFGRDLCVIYVWKGWEVVYIVVIRKSDSNDIVKVIERLRRKFNVLRRDVLVDQDGLGSGTVKLGHYTGFHGNALAMKDPDTRKKENYANLKTQCVYRMGERINEGGIRINIDQCVEIWEPGHDTPFYTSKLKMGNGVTTVFELLKADIMAWRKKNQDMDGKKQIIDKSEMKEILKRSPDFGDALLIREYLDLKPAPKHMQRTN